MSETTRSNDQGDAMDATTLVMALELSSAQWKVAFTTGVAQRPRRRTVRREQWGHFASEIAAAKARFHLPPEAPVVSCYEAGPDGFWVHRFLTALGVTNLVIDSASIEVSRRAPRQDGSLGRRAAAGAGPAVRERRAHRAASDPRTGRSRRAPAAVASRAPHTHARSRARHESDPWRVADTWHPRLGGCAVRPHPDRVYLGPSRFRC